MKKAMPKGGGGTLGGEGETYSKKAEWVAGGGNQRRFGKAFVPCAKKKGTWDGQGGCEGGDYSAACQRYGGDDAFNPMFISDGEGGVHA